MVKTLEPHIKKAFSDLGFTDEEIRNGCWLLEKAFKKGEEKRPIAWIAYHKFLERVAQKANIVFDKPEVMNCQENEVAIYVRGTTPALVGGQLNQAWSIGEASSKNCTNEYRWAMAEKRAKDRVILKLLGVAGDMYSEEEADEFKKYDEDYKTPAQKAAETRQANKESKDGYLKQYEAWMDWFAKHTGEISTKSVVAVQLTIAGLDRFGLNDKANALNDLLQKAKNDSVPEFKPEEYLRAG